MRSSQDLCALPCRVGGGIRSVERATEVLAGGATHAIVGSALFRMAGSTSRSPNARGDGGAPGDRRRRQQGWAGRHRRLAHEPAVTAVEADRALEPFFGGFLYTPSTEGLLQGTDMAAIRAVREATGREVIAAGGITTIEEVDELHAMGVDAVVGMALYTGRLALPERP